jgi:hypothetical protein
VQLAKALPPLLHHVGLEDDAEIGDAPDHANLTARVLCPPFVLAQELRGILGDDEYDDTTLRFDP